MIIFTSDRSEARFERQLKPQEDLVLHDINKNSETKITKERLYEVLEILYGYRVVD